MRLNNYNKAFQFAVISLVLMCFVALQAVANTGKSQRFDKPVILGYYANWAIYSPNVHVQDLPVHKMTHLVYKSANLTQQGEVEPGDDYADIERLYPTTTRQNSFLGSFGRLLEVKADHPKLKTIISIGGWGRSEHYSTLAANASGREILAKNAIAFMQKYQFDGIEIDWQFPIYRSRTPGVITKRVDDANNLILLLKEIRRQCQALARSCWLQSIVAPYSLKSSWDGRALAEQVDLVVVDTSRIPGDQGEFAEPQSPLYNVDNKPSIDSIVKTLNAFGVPREKIVFSVASFAVSWDGVPAHGHGLRQEPEKLSWGSWDGWQSGSTGIYNQKTLHYFYGAEQYEQYWDELTKSSFLYSEQTFDGHFIAFESRRSIAEKVDYAKKNGLAGIAVRQLHNGTETLSNVFHHYHFFLSNYFKVAAFASEHRAALIVLSQMLAIIVIAIVIFILLHNKKRQQTFEQQKIFAQQQYGLQMLEWPLVNIMTLSNKLRERGVVDPSTVTGLTQLSAQLLAPVNNILSNTVFNSTVNHQIVEPVQLNLVLQNIAELIRAEHRVGHQLSSDVEVSLLVNSPSFQQLIHNVSDFSVNHLAQGQLLKVNVLSVAVGVSIQWDMAKNSVKQFNHARLNSLYRQAKAQGFSIQVNAADATLALHIPQECLLACTNRFALNVSQQQQDAPEQGRSEQITKQSSNDLTETHTQESPDLFVGLASFNMTSSPSKDIYKSLEHACEYFIGLLNQDTQITINHHDQLVSKLGVEQLNSPNEVIVNAEDISVEIMTSSALSEQDQQLIQVLVYQVLMVQKAIQSLLNEPTVLAELYELTRHKDKVYYLKAESGYTGIYTQGRKEPRYISMRLRTVKLYFDDSFLVQIHRSYLVNPKKVSHVEQVSKLKYLMVVGSEKLPISRGYLVTLKQQFPHWFN